MLLSADYVHVHYGLVDVLTYVKVITYKNVHRVYNTLPGVYTV